MHKRWFFTLTLICLVAISISCLWMASPQTLAPTKPLPAAQSGDYYQLIDRGGFVTVVHIVSQTPESTSKTTLMVNLLPEDEALHIKSGYYIPDETTLQNTLLALQNLL